MIFLLAMGWSSAYKNDEDRVWRHKDGLGVRTSLCNSPYSTPLWHYNTELQLADMGSKGILLVYNNHGDHRPIFIKTGSGRYSQLPVKGGNHQVYGKRRIYFQDNLVKGHNLTEKQEGRIFGNTETGGRVRRKGRDHSKNPGHLLRLRIIWNNIPCRRNHRFFFLTPSYLWKHNDIQDNQGRRYIRYMSPLGAHITWFRWFYWSVFLPSKLLGYQRQSLPSGSWTPWLQRLHGE